LREGSLSTSPILAILKETVSRWNYHEAPRLGAAIAFYALLALAPLVVFLVVIVSGIFGTPAAERRVVQDAYILMGNLGANTVQDLLASTRKPAQGAIASALATLTLLVGASAVFSELRDCLNSIWGVRPRTGGLRAVCVHKMFSFMLVLAAGLLLLISMLATTVVSLFGHFLGDLITVPTFLLESVNFVLSLGMFTAVFALIFRFVPDLVLPWRLVWRGAAVSALLFALGKTVLGLYLSWASVGSAYGAAGSLVAIAVWVYYSAQIFLLGAEFTYVCGEVYFPDKLTDANSRSREVYTTRKPDPSAHSSAIQVEEKLRD